MATAQIVQPEERTYAVVPKETGLQRAFGALSVEDVVAQVALIQQVMKATMKEGTHYGKIPGCGDKPSLLKAGAEKLGFVFRLAPEFEAETLPQVGEHREVRVVCRLRTVASGLVVGEGVGSCSTLESKYRWRKGERVCPECGADAIKRSKFPPRANPKAKPGWYCYAKVGGCGVEFAFDDERIERQNTGRIENPDIADCYNTVLKMAKKRAYVDATITATAAGDIFTQDIEDFVDGAAPVDDFDDPEPPRPAPAPRAPRAKSGPRQAKRIEATPDVRTIATPDGREKRVLSNWETLIAADPDDALAYVPSGTRAGEPLAALSDAELSSLGQIAESKQGGYWPALLAGTRRESARRAAEQANAANGTIEEFEGEGDDHE